MRNYVDTDARSKLGKIQRAMENSLLVVSYSEIDRGGPPILSAANIGVTRDYDRGGYSGKTSWGRFRLETDIWCWICESGEIPEHLKDQPKLLGGKAGLYNDYTSIVLEDGRTFEIDFQARDENLFDYPRQITKILYEMGMSVWVYEVERKEERTKSLHLANESAMLPATFAVIDRSLMQLVATELVVGGVDMTLVKALKASLAKSSSRNHRDVTSIKLIEMGGKTVYMTNTGKGFLTIANTFASKGAIGQVIFLMNPLAGNPTDYTDDVYYILARQGENINDLFTERFQIASIWGIQPEWAAYLISMGSKEGLIRQLEMFGKSPYVLGLAVLKNDTRWKGVIEKGLSEGKLTIKES